MEKLFLYVLVLCWKIIPCTTCELSNITIVLEKEECAACMTVNTTWCSGYCYTKEYTELLQDSTVKDANVHLGSVRIGFQHSLSVHQTFSEDPNLMYPHRSEKQGICTYTEVIFETVKIPGCPENINPFYTYPVAVDCHCGRCDSETTDCTVRGLGPTYCSISKD